MDIVAPWRSTPGSDRLVAGWYQWSNMWRPSSFVNHRLSYSFWTMETGGILVVKFWWWNSGGEILVKLPTGLYIRDHIQGFRRVLGVFYGTPRWNSGRFAIGSGSSKRLARLLDLQPRELQISSLPRLLPGHGTKEILKFHGWVISNSTTIFVANWLLPKKINPHPQETLQPSRPLHCWQSPS